jgi:hypothetical protein
MPDTNSDFQEKEIESFLESEDIKYGKNSVDQAPPLEKTETKNPGLGRSISSQVDASSVSGANDNFWKNLPLENLPSRGMFYPDGAELTFRSASAAEIRHWSTMDESDILDIDDKLNFIIEKCTRFKLNGGHTWLSWRDILEVDRLFIIFLIHEITFTDGQNELFVKVECNSGSCAEDEKYSDEIKVRSSMLQLFKIPDELLEWYSPQYRCFEVVSGKLNETFYLYAPTLGTVERLRKRISEIKSQGRQIDKSFIKMAPYLIQDWSTFDAAAYSKLSNDSIGWHINKFTFITKFSESMQSARDNSLVTTCPKCGSEIASPIFSRDSFTIKDLFLISGRLNQLI